LRASSLRIQRHRTHRIVESPGQPGAIIHVEHMLHAMQIQRRGTRIKGWRSGERLSRCQHRRPLKPPVAQIVEGDVCLVEGVGNGARPDPRLAGERKERIAIGAGQVGD